MGVITLCYTPFSQHFSECAPPSACICITWDWRGPLRHPIGVSMGVLGYHLSSGSGWCLTPGDIGQPGKVRSLGWQVLGALRRDRRFMPSVPPRMQQAHDTALLPRAGRLRTLRRCFPGCRFRLCWALVPGPSEGSEPQYMPPGQQVPPVAT